MMSTHPDVVEFMTLYEEVQRLSGGRPDRIPFLFKNDQKFAEVCRRLARLYQNARRGELHAHS